MTMPLDSSRTAPARLDDETLASVRGAISAYLSKSDGDALHSALVIMSTEAREKDVLPEQLLVTLKDLWVTLPEVRAMTNYGEQVRLLQTVVTLCIKEYYSS